MFKNITLTKRLILSNLFFLVVVGFAFFIVIRSLSHVETALNTQVNGHISELTKMSDISRRVVQLTTRVELLEQAFLFSETALAREAFHIDLELQHLRQLSINHELSKKMDIFIDNFHRFLGSSLSLNRILKKTQETDDQLAIQLDELELILTDHWMLSGHSPEAWNHNNQLDSISTLRETFLTTGKMVSNISAQITPETERTLIIEVEKELDIFLLNLENTAIDTAAVNKQKKSMFRTLRKYNAAMRRIKANLEQRWIVVDLLIDSQNVLLSTVEQSENTVKTDILELTNSLREEISQSRLHAILISIFALILSTLIFSYVIKKHIKRPLDDLSEGFDRIESSEVSMPIRLHRKDEWNNIEKAFNNMSMRLSDAYTELNAEKKSFDYLAHHDPLTGLSNRLLGTQTLSEKIKAAKQNNTSFLLLYLDIDEFKTINDSLGHKSGDNLLKSVASILQDVIRDIGHISRMGGDEFMILIDDQKTVEHGSSILDKINISLRQAYYINDKNVFVSSSIGVCKYPEHGLDEETLIRNADTAMYHAKRNGKDQYRMYTDRMTLEVTDIIETNAGLHRAIENEELVVYFQPKIDVNSQKIVGAEALVRWQHPTLGLLPPADFLEVAEKTDLIIEIDKWMFKKVANFITEWQKSGINIDGAAFSVNFSSRLFYMDDLTEQLNRILSETDCKPHQLILEITERDMMRDMATCQQTIDSLRSQGYKIAIDDFGTGYSSLSVVKNLSVDYLKIDRSFIQDIDSSQLDYEITNAIVKLAHILDLSVIAEGVEKQKHLDQLTELNCNWAQGYFFSKPLPVDDFLPYFNNNSK